MILTKVLLLFFLLTIILFMYEFKACDLILLITIICQAFPVVPQRTVGLQKHISLYADDSSAFKIEAEGIFMSPSLCSDKSS